MSQTYPYGPTITSLNAILQPGFLQRLFVDSLKPLLVYRDIADKEIFPGRIGQTITMTRIGLLTPNVNRLNPATNNTLDNGMSVQNAQQEQYLASIGQYPQNAGMVNLADNEVYIADLIAKNTENLAWAIATTINRVAQNNLFSAYMGGNTRITAAGTTVTTISVDDVRGFMTVLVNGVVTAVSSSNPLNITINNVANTVTGFTIDGTNTSTAINIGRPYSGSTSGGALVGDEGGISGTLTIGTAATVVVAQAVIGLYAPQIVRPNAKTTTLALATTDLLSFDALLTARDVLVNNGIPKKDGWYHCFLGSSSMSQLYRDERFDLLTRGRGTGDKDWEDGVIDKVLGIKFHETTEVYQQSISSTGVTVQRPILCGGGTLIEEQFDPGLDAIRSMADLNAIGTLARVDTTQEEAAGAYMYLRKPLDALGENINQAANWMGGYAVPSDSTSTPNTIRTANNAYFKRSVILETA